MSRVESKLENNVLIFFITDYCDDEAGKDILTITQETFTNNKPAGVIFDFTKCKALNSSGIAQIMDSTELITGDFKSSAVVCGLDKTKIAFFKMFGLLDMAELKTDLEAAKHYLGICQQTRTE